MVNIRLWMIVLLLFSSLGTVHAWSGYTHEWICVHAGVGDLDCRSADNVKVQKLNPGLGFVNHHCTLNRSNCSARIQADKFLDANTTQSTGFAAHLYADSMVPAHWYSTDYDSCHGIFEDTVEENLRNTGYAVYIVFGDAIETGEWQVNMSCETKDGNIVTLYADDEYMESVAQYVAANMGSTYSPPQQTVYDLTPVVVLLMALVLIVLVLFIVYGLKNRNR